MDQDNGKKWEMPEPKFRRSEGEPVTPAADLSIDPEPDTLAPDAPDESEIETGEFDVNPNSAAAAPPATEPVGPDDQVPAASGDPLAKLYDPPSGPLSAPKAPSAASAASTVPAVEPQPFISEQFTADKIDVGGSATGAAPRSRPVLALLGVVLVLAAAAAIAGLVYFLFFAGRPVPVAN